MGNLQRLVYGNPYTVWLLCAAGRSRLVSALINVTAVTLRLGCTRFRTPAFGAFMPLECTVFRTRHRNGSVSDSREKVDALAAQEKAEAAPPLSAGREGLELRIGLTAEQADVLSADAELIAGQVRVLLSLLVAVRSGERMQPEEWYDAARTLDQLRHELDGIMAVVMRSHTGTPGGLSVAELADATGVTRSTAQTRRESVLSRPASDWERWAASAAVPARPTAMPRTAKTPGG